MEWSRPRTCPWCIGSFIPKAPTQKYCCDPHQNIAKSVRRKARLRGAAVGEPPSLWAIYERDGGKCRLCYEEVDRTLRAPDRRRASIDHIIPISQGGKDGSNNVQLAHLACNVARQAKPLWVWYRMAAEEIKQGKTLAAALGVRVEDLGQELIENWAAFLERPA